MLRLGVARNVSRIRPQTARLALGQWTPEHLRVAPAQRFFADINGPDKAVLPGSQSSKTVAGVPQAPILKADPVTNNRPATDIPPAAAPRTPPSPEEVNAALPTPPTGTRESDSKFAPPLPPRRPRRRLRRLLLTLIVLSALGYAGGVYYSLVSDNFHDFFTEYVPYGEDAVAYFEEREFRKRFPRKESASKAWGQTRGESKVTIGRSSGLHPKVADVGSEDLGQRGRHVSALTNDSQPNVSTAQQPVVASPQEKAKAAAESVTKSSTERKPNGVSKRNDAKPVEQPVTPPSTATSSAKEQASIAAVNHIDLEQAEEPAVQSLVKMINNVITALNSSPDGAQFSPVVQSLKSDLDKVASEIGSLKSKHVRDAESQLKDAHTEFDIAAKELVRRVEQEMREQELKWREEYEAERDNLSRSYHERLAAELDTVQKIAEQQTTNSLLQQEIALQKQYMDLVRSKVEEEREGRLARLDELSASVSEMEKLTSAWNGIVDATMQTQHLQIAVEAIKAKVLDSEIPTPFLSELVALKGVSQDDKVVNAAISSINPLAYQRGIASPAHLIDRFRRVATEVRKAALLPEDAGVASHAASAVLSRLMFQKKADRGLPEGDDVEATLARAEALLEEGDLDSAAREVNGLQGWAGVLSRDWVDECRRVLEVRQAVDVIATQARLKSLLVN